MSDGNPVVTRPPGLRRLEQLRSISTGLLELSRTPPSGQATIWLGDSHTRFNLGHPEREGRFVRISDADFVWSIGPRLMYSVARRGWPADVRMGAAFVRRASRRLKLHVCSILGEIDVRVFLGERYATGTLDLSFVAAYVEQCVELARMMHATPVVVVPVPPCGEPDPQHEYPRICNLEQRVAAHQELRRALRESTHSRGVLLFDPTSSLALPSGALRPPLTADGLHLNSPGSDIFTAEWTAFNPPVGETP